MTHLVKMNKSRQGHHSNFEFLGCKRMQGSKTIGKQSKRKRKKERGWPRAQGVFMENWFKNLFKRPCPKSLVLKALGPFERFSAILGAIRMMVSMAQRMPTTYNNKKTMARGNIDLYQQVG